LPPPRQGRSISFYDAQIGKGLKPKMARLTLARKIAAITLIV
jgi:hypothetical protein